MAGTNIVIDMGGSHIYPRHPLYNSNSNSNFSSSSNYNSNSSFIPTDGRRNYSNQNTGNIAGNYNNSTTAKGVVDSDLEKKKKGGKLSNYCKSVWGIQPRPVNFGTSAYKLRT